MKNHRQLTWDDYGISRNRYEELRAFCLQYQEKKAKINRSISGSMNYDGMPKGNYKENMLEKTAIQNVIYEKDCEMIEKAAVAAGKDIAPYIFKSVTNGLSYQFVEYDQELGRIPVCKTEFYAIRRLFYHYLDEMKNMNK